MNDALTFGGVRLFAAVVGRPLAGREESELRRVCLPVAGRGRGHVAGI